MLNILSLVDVHNLHDVPDLQGRHQDDGRSAPKSGPARDQLSEQAGT